MGRKGAPEPIRIGAVQATTCSRCGARGHAARECFADAGVHYELLEEPPDEGLPPTRDKVASAQARERKRDASKVEKTTNSEFQFFFVIIFKFMLFRHPRIHKEKEGQKRIEGISWCGRGQQSKEQKEEEKERADKKEKNKKG